MKNFSEEVTKTWISKKGILLSNRPKVSKFSFFVCFSIVISLGIGVIIGFLVASFADKENYSSVYATLIQELEDAKYLLNREKEELKTLKIAKEELNLSLINASNTNFNFSLQEQAIFGVFGHAVDLLQNSHKSQACNELYNIANLAGYDGEWKNKAIILYNKNCK